MANLYENSAAPSHFSELWKCSDVTRYLNLIKYEMEHISTSETEKKINAKYAKHDKYIVCGYL